MAPQKQQLPFHLREDLWRLLVTGAIVLVIVVALGIVEQRTHFIQRWSEQLNLAPSAPSISAPDVELPTTTTPTISPEPSP